MADPHRSPRLTHSVISMWSTRENGPMRVSQSNSVPTPVVCRDGEVDRDGVLHPVDVRSDVLDEHRPDLAGRGVDVDRRPEPSHARTLGPSTPATEHARIVTDSETGHLRRSRWLAMRSAGRLCR